MSDTIIAIWKLIHVINYCIIHESKMHSFLKFWGLGYVQNTIYSEREIEFWPLLYVGLNRRSSILFCGGRSGWAVSHSKWRETESCSKWLFFFLLLNDQNNLVDFKKLRQISLFCLEFSSIIRF